MKFEFFKTRKAQSATEYLMTYGWAILAIAIVGALLYTQVFSSSNCSEATAGGFDMVSTLAPLESQFQVYADGSAQIVVKNNAGKTVTLQSVEVPDGTDVTGIAQAITSGETFPITTATLPAGTFPTGTQDDCFNGIELVLVYDVTDGLTGMRNPGTLSGKYY